MLFIWKCFFFLIFKFVINWKQHILLKLSDKHRFSEIMYSSNGSFENGYPKMYLNYLPSNRQYFEMPTSGVDSLIVSSK